MAKQYITYEPIDWAQGVSGGTPLNASNLNRMEDAIEELVEKVNAPITSDDIGEDAVGNAQIAADSVTSDKLAQSVRDSLSRGINVLPQTGSGNFEASSFNLRIASNAIEFQFPIKGSDFSFYSLAFLFSGSILIYRRSRAYPDTPDETLLRLA